MQDLKTLVQYAQQHPEKVYFTSDTHFGHANIIKLCNRPFSDVKEMNEKLIENWNKTVEKDAIVFHLGDFCFGGTTLWKEVRSRLNGYLVLIKGNHDEHNLKPSLESIFDAVTYQAYFKMSDNITVYLNHYPFLCYGGSYKTEHNVWQLFGHVHSGPNNTGLDNDRLCHCFPTQYDVGVDNNDYAPVSWNKIKEIISNRIANGSIN